jgi:DNA-directed RNA polymerase specialized sigma24 family protein
MISDEKIKTIQRVCQKLANKYTFGYYSAEDIQQEAFLMALKALPQHDPSIAALETFLYIHLNNKLKTFKRDHYIRKDFTCVHCHRQDPDCDYCKRREWRHAAKKYIMEPIDIDHVNGDAERNMSSDSEVLLNVELNEILSIINQELDVELREDYLKMVGGITIPKHKRLIIENNILNILEKYDYYDQQTRSLV